ncbi:cytochrome P450 family protein [Nonomuraea typhae]|uniref:cytochrome P450 family protein n=1 Tax=Nonomuraea typhae TaxID=2603600 RepID=UPI0012FBDAA6|nr:cytochrome P450 [Nonomuraea typhae]
MREKLDLSDQQFVANPYSTYARLREEQPVCPVTQPNGLYGWIITRYDDAWSALADPRLSHDPRRGPADWQQAGRGMPLEDRSGLGTHLLTTDPPEHTRLRRLVASAFTPRRVERLRGRVHEITDTLIGKIQPRGTAELIDDFAVPLAGTIISELIGIPEEDRARLHEWTASVVGEQGAPVTRQQALANLGDYLLGLIAVKRAAPAEDLVSTVLTAHDEAGRLTEQEALSLIFMLLVTGQESTVAFIGNGMLALLRHPDQLALLRERPELMGPAVEEILRYDGAAERVAWRFPTEPVQIGGTWLAPGDPLLIALAAADRDPVRFADPDRFDITRSDSQPHVAFGRGIHYCPGAPLIRLEGPIALSALINRLPDLDLAVPYDRLRWRKSLTLRCLAELPVTFAPAAQ